MGITKMTKGCDTIEWNKLWRESGGRDQRGMTAEPKAGGGGAAKPPFHEKSRRPCDILHIQVRSLLISYTDYRKEP